MMDEGGKRGKGVLEGFVCFVSLKCLSSFEVELVEDTLDGLEVFLALLVVDVGLSPFRYDLVLKIFRKFHDCLCCVCMCMDGVRVGRGYRCKCERGRGGNEEEREKWEKEGRE